MDQDWKIKIKVDGGYGDSIIPSLFSKNFPSIELSREFVEIKEEKNFVDISTIANLDTITIHTDNFFVLYLAHDELKRLPKLISFFSKFGDLSINGNSMDNKYGLIYHNGQYDIIEAEYVPTYPLENLVLRRKV